MARTRSATGTAVETYLRARGLTVSIPDVLGFAILWHRPTRQYLPAMVASVHRWPDLQPVAVHRTFLTPDGRGKANVPDPKLSYGPIRNAAIQLASPDHRLLVAEGIETALSGQQEAGIPAWAAISASNMIGLSLPELPFAREIVIAADNDPAGLSAARRAAAKWSNEGRIVRIAVPPEGLDLNDVLQETAE